MPTLKLNTTRAERTPRPRLTLSASLRLSLVVPWLDRLQPSSVLEAGCGVGGMAVHLAKHHQYRGYEPDRQSWSIARQRLEGDPDAQVINSVVPAIPDRSFDMVCAFEVLEHVEDDDEALRTWLRWLSPGGHLVISVPAHPHRFGPCDRAVGHCRRYSRESLVGVLADAGLEVLAIETWGMPMGYLLEGLRNLLVRLHRGAEVGTEGSGRLFQPTRTTGLINAIALPASIMQRPFKDTNWGTGFVAVARANRSPTR